MANLQEEMQEMQKVPIEFLAFSGGGAKGAIYSGVYAALKESGTINGVKAVAGSSAGAITAAMVASGIDAQEFEKITKETNFKNLLGTSDTANKLTKFLLEETTDSKSKTAKLLLKERNIKGVLDVASNSLHQFASSFSRDGKPLYDLLDKTIRKNCLQFFNENKIMEVCQSRLENISKEQLRLEQEKQNLLQQQIHDPDFITNEDPQNIDYQQQELQRDTKKIELIIQDQWQELITLKRKCQKNDGKISFKDLALLQLIDPVRFKDLIVTAVRQDNGELQIFSAENTPNVEIALACRASASLPVLLEPVEIDNIKYVDGGYRDNIPMKYFSDNKFDFGVKDLTANTEKISKAKKQGRIFALVFGSHMDESTNVAIYSAKNVIYILKYPQEFLLQLLAKILAKIGGPLKYIETVQDTHNNLRKNSLDTLVLNTQSIDSFNFGNAQKHVNYLHMKGYYQTLNHLHNHELNKDTGKTFEAQEFLLNVYEHYDNDNLNQSYTRQLWGQIMPQEKPVTSSKWQEHIIHNHRTKAVELLSFCKPERWQEKVELSSILKDYIMLTATSRNNEMKTDTKAMSALIATLNNSTTASKIKEDFVKLLNIHEEHDIRFDQSKSRIENIAQLQFKQEDFQKFISRYKNEPFRASNSRSYNVGRG